MVQFDIPEDLLPYLVYLPEDKIGDMFIDLLRKAISVDSVTTTEGAQMAMLKEILSAVKEGVAPKAAIYKSELIALPKIDRVITEDPSRALDTQFGAPEDSSNLDAIEEDFLADIMK